MRVAIITGPGLAMTHGTGAQILRVFGNGAADFFHLYWSLSPFGPSECRRSFHLANRGWAYPRGGRLAHALIERLRLWWWQADQVNGRNLALLMAWHRLHPDVAYVVVASEHEACRANSLLSQLRCPYIVHLMDTAHEHGLEPTLMPEYGRLLEHASAVLVLNEALKRETLKFPTPGAEVVAFGQEVTPCAARAPDGRTGLKVLMAGSLQMHQEGMRLLAEAWPSVIDRHPGSEIVYTGADFASMPPALRSIVTNHGYVSPERYVEIIAGSHIGYLAGPAVLNALGRFSVPSRLSDLLMGGLPVLACVAAGSAAEAFLEPLLQSCACVIHTPDAFLQALDDYGTPERWTTASRAARAFAVQHLSIETVRGRVFDALSRAVAREHRP